MVDQWKSVQSLLDLYPRLQLCRCRTMQYQDFPVNYVCVHIKIYIHNKILTEPGFKEKQSLQSIHIISVINSSITADYCAHAVEFNYIF